MNVISRKEVDSSSDVIAGDFSINSILVKALFDYGVTYSFISKETLGKFGLSEPETIEVPTVIPTGSIVSCTKINRNVPLTIPSTVFPSNVIEFELGDLDVILGMAWLSMFKDKIDCEKNKVNPRKRVSYLRS